MSASGITASLGKKQIQILPQGIKLTSATGVNLSLGPTNVNVQGTNIELNAKAQMTTQGATAKHTATGPFESGGGIAKLGS